MRLLGRIRDQYDNFNLRKKFFAVAVLLSVLPMTLLQMMNFLSATGIMRRQMEHMQQASLQQIHSVVNSALTAYQSLIADIGNDEAIAGYAAEINVWDLHYQMAKRRLREELKEAVFAKEGILGAAVFSSLGDYAYYDAVTLSNIESFCYPLREIHRQPIVRDAIREPGRIFIRTQKKSRPGYADKNIVYLATGLRDFKNLRREPIGVILLCVDERILSDAYREEPAPGGAPVTLVVDKSGSVISASSGALLGGSLIQDTVSIEDGAAQYIQNSGVLADRPLTVKSYASPDSGFTVVRAQPGNFPFSRIYFQGIGVTVAGALIILAVILAINRTSNNIAAAVRHIVDSMRQANAGNLDVRIMNNGKDEFAQISQSFNAMISEMKNLIQKENRALRQQKEAEIRALEAQINPHFLYNTLDSIHWVAVENKQAEISKMLKYLAIILRYSITDSNGVVTLEEELGYLKKYIYLQQNRFNYSFLCLMRVQDEARRRRIHKLLIQPLIENSIEHAFPSPGGQDKIEIEAVLTEERQLCITVSDNGVGMDAALIEELNHFGGAEDGIRTNIGIRNVISRLRIYYGGQGGLRIERNPDNGIRIILRIPYEDERQGGMV